MDCGKSRVKEMVAVLASWAIAKGQSAKQTTTEGKRRVRDPATNQRTSIIGKNDCNGRQDAGATNRRLPAAPAWLTCAGGRWRWRERRRHRPGPGGRGDWGGASTFAEPVAC